MQALLLKSRTSLTITCAKKKDDSPMHIARKNFEKKRTVGLKENVNKLLQIANADAKVYGDFFHELDAIHKKAIADWTESVQEKLSEAASRAAGTSSEDDETSFFKKEKKLKKESTKEETDEKDD